MTKTEALAELRNAMVQDASLPLREANLVFGEGAPDCTVMFIGEAPGANEDRLGRPFVGLAGKLLDELIKNAGWQREAVYITNIVKRRPPENRDPLPEEIAAYAPYLSRQIEIVNPPIIAPLGRFSMNYFLPEAKISRDQGKVFLRDGRKIVPLYHPAAALRATAVKEELARSFLRLSEIAAGKVKSIADSLPPARAESALKKAPPRGLF